MWEPRSEADIALAISDGNLYESASIDVKRELGDSPSSRRETAKDLASFATTGGALLVGVAENKEARRFELAPVPLKDAVERIEQIAAMRVDPPLFVRVREVPASGDSTFGYLWVDIPPSGQSPHMVDGIYYGRGERTTRRLTDGEVEALHRLRYQRGHVAGIALDEEMERDPIPRERREQAHMYLVAEPLNAVEGAARSIVRSGTNAELMQLVHRVEQRLPLALRDLAPRPTAAYHFANRSRGASLSTIDRTVAKTSFADWERRLVDIEVAENGGVRLLCGRLTLRRDANAQPEVFDGLLVAYALRLAYLAQDVSAATGYRGSWAFGVHASGLRGAPSSKLAGEWGERQSAYDVDDYRELSLASGAEVEEQPVAIATRLVARLLRGLGSARHFADVLSAGDL